MSRSLSIPLLLLCLYLLPSSLPAQHPAAEMGFGFRNPGGSLTYSWEVFRNAFYGVPVDSGMAWFTAPFDMLLYNEAIRSKMANADGDTINGSGRCFGWSTAGAMMWKYGGYRGFCGPPVRYRGADPVTGNPLEPGLTRAIEITQIQQLTLANIQGIIDQTIGGHSQQASYAHSRILEGIERDGVVIIGVTKTLDPLTGAAHAVIGYDVVDSTLTLKKVMVVDPNRTWGVDDPADRGWYERGDNFLLLDLASDKWRFHMGGTHFDWPVDGQSVFDSTEAAQLAAGTTDTATVMAAHPLGTGHLITYPLATAGVPGRTPTSLGLGIGQLLAKFWIYNEEGTGSRILQMTDADGRRLLDPATGRIDYSRETGMPGTAPFYPMLSRLDDDRQLPFSLWFRRGIVRDASMRIRTGSGPMRLTVGDNPGYFRLRSRGADAEISLSFTGLGTPTPQITIEGTTAPVTLDLELYLPVRPGETHRRYFVESLHLDPADAATPTISLSRTGELVWRNLPLPSDVRLLFRQESLRNNETRVSSPLVPDSYDGSVRVDQWEARGDGVETGG